MEETSITGQVEGIEEVDPENLEESLSEDLLRELLEEFIVERGPDYFTIKLQSGGTARCRYLSIFKKRQLTHYMRQYYELSQNISEDVAPQKLAAVEVKILYLLLDFDRDDDREFDKITESFSTADVGTVMQIGHLEHIKDSILEDEDDVSGKKST